jgi:hypothetical protein
MLGQSSNADEQKFIPAEWPFDGLKWPFLDLLSE